MTGSRSVGQARSLPRSDTIGAAKSDWLSAPCRLPRLWKPRGRVWEYAKILLGREGSVVALMAICAALKARAVKKFRLKAQGNLGIFLGSIFGRSVSD